MNYSQGDQPYEEQPTEDELDELETLAELHAEDEEELEKQEEDTD